MQIFNNISSKKGVKKLNVNRVTDLGRLILKIVYDKLKETLTKCI